MGWAVAFVLLGAAGVAVVAVLAVRLWRDVRDLGRAVVAANQTLGEAAAKLEAAASRGRAGGTRVPASAADAGLPPGPDPA